MKTILITINAVIMSVWSWFGETNRQKPIEIGDFFLCNTVDWLLHQIVVDVVVVHVRREEVRDLGCDGREGRH